MPRAKKQTKTEEAPARRRRGPECITDPDFIPTLQDQPGAAVGVVESVEMSLPSPKNTAISKPDLLAHPYHQYIADQGMECMFVDKEMLDFRQTQGWRIFKRPADMEDQHMVFHGTDGDTVQRGGLILCVRPAMLGEAERQMNYQSYQEEIQELQREMKEEKAPAKGSVAEGQVTVTPAHFDQVGPTDGFQS